MTEPDKMRQKDSRLSVEQLNAVDQLVLGLSDREVAEKVGVARQTVTNWRLRHPGLQAELNRRRKEIWGSSGDKLRSLLPKALDRLEKMLVDDGNPNAWRVAIELLRATGLYANDKHDSGDIGEDDAREIAKSAVKKRSPLDVMLEELTGSKVSEEEIDASLEEMLRKAGSERSQKAD